MCVKNLKGKTNFGKSKRNMTFYNLDIYYAPACLENEKYCYILMWNAVGIKISLAVS